MRNLFLILTLALALASAEPTNDKGDTVPEEVIEEVKASEDKPADNDDTSSVDTNLNILYLN
uniref:Uncharacterized protein n=1 Tax=Anopheles coluzzii TaxID=1518534 RepID=A0A6E8W587_ANOCL